jgi:hypothetical protein
MGKAHWEFSKYIDKKTEKSYWGVDRCVNCGPDVEVSETHTFLYTDDRLKEMTKKWDELQKKDPGISLKGNGTDTFALDGHEHSIQRDNF